MTTVMALTFQSLCFFPFVYFLFGKVFTCITGCFFSHSLEHKPDRRVRARRVEETRRPPLLQSRGRRWKVGMTAMRLGDCLLLILCAPCHFSFPLPYISTSLFLLFSQFSQLAGLLCVNCLFSFSQSAAFFLCCCYCCCELSTTKLLSVMR